MVQLGEELLAGQVGDNGRLDGDGARRPRPLVDRRQLAEQLAGRLDPEHQLAARRQGDEDADPPFQAHVHGPGVVTFVEERLAGREHEPMTARGDQIADGDSCCPPHVPSRTHSPKLGELCDESHRREPTPSARSM